MKALLLIAATAVITFSTTSINAQEMPGGLWEIKTKIDMPGMPPEAAQFANQKMTHCVKPGERKWTEQRNPNDRSDKQCEQTGMKVEGNKVSWKMACKDGMTGEGTVTHNGKDAYKMDMTMNMPQGSMKMQTEGRRIADTCDKK